MKESYQNESGLTLVEILASIVILSIVIMTFLMVFGQSAKTTQRSEETIESTYIAQKEMENVYELSREKTFEKAIDGFNKISEDDSGWDTYEVSNPPKDYRITLEFKDTDEGMKRVLIKVYQKSNSDRIEAQMENLFKWKD